jgi:hypothetical protein
VAGWAAAKAVVDAAAVDSEAEWEAVAMVVVTGVAGSAVDLEEADLAADSEVEEMVAE